MTLLDKAGSGSVPGPEFNAVVDALGSTRPPTVTSLIFREITAPDTPPPGHDALFFDSDDGSLKYIDDQGQEHSLGGNGGSQPWIGPFTIYAMTWQVVDMSGDPPDGGTLKLSYNSVETAAIAWDANAAAWEAALDAIPALTGKVTVTEVSGDKAAIVLDDSIVAPLLIELADNALTASAAPVDDPLIYSGVVNINPLIPLFTPTTGDVLEDFLLSVPSLIGPFGTGSSVYFDTDDGNVDWPDTAGLKIDNSDNSEEWGGGSDSAADQYRSLALSQPIAGNGYNLVPCPIYTASEIRANLLLAGQGTIAAQLNIWVKTAGVRSPA